jgi:hypothetical protein
MTTGKELRMRNLKTLVPGLGLAVLALTAGRSAADPTCEQQCRINNQQCRTTCSQSLCLISCDQQLQYCLASCGSAS